MDELVKALRYYISRDLVFLISGGAVVATFVHVFVPALSLREWPSIGLALVVGISYVIGYAVQDIFSVVRVVTTAPWEPGCVTKCVYRRFTQTEWSSSALPTPSRVNEWERASAAGRVPDYERVVMLMQIGTAGGPCASICAFILLWPRSGLSRLDTVLGIGAAVLAIVLLLLGRLKVAQMTNFLREPPPAPPVLPPDA